MVKAVIFDLDGTLLNREASILQFLEQQYERLSALWHIEKQRYIDRFISVERNGYVWKDQVYAQLVVDFTINDMTAAQLLADYQAHFHDHCVAFPNLHDMLDLLQQSGYKIGMITNGFGTFQLDTLRALQIHRYFDEILVSELEGITKPDPRIFQRASERLRVPLAQCVYIGDHPINDVAAAQQVGMIGIWMNNVHYERVDADFTIDDLAEIPRLLELLP